VKRLRQDGIQCSSIGLWTTKNFAKKARKISRNLKYLADFPTNHGELAGFWPEQVFLASRFCGIYVRGSRCGTPVLAGKPNDQTR
jgi:hypothetical protein